MILGRVEIVTILVVFTKGFWKELLGVSGMLEARERVVGAPRALVSHLKSKKGEVPDAVGSGTEEGTDPKE